MKPIVPIIPNHYYPVTKIAESQKEYGTLPAYVDSYGNVASRWKLSFWERLKILITGDVYLIQSTFHQPLQPVLLQVEVPAILELEK